MTRARDLASLLDSGGDIVTSALDNVSGSGVFLSGGEFTANTSSRYFTLVLPSALNTNNHSTALIKFYVDSDDNGFGLSHFQVMPTSTGALGNSLASTIGPHQIYAYKTTVGEHGSERYFDPNSSTYLNGIKEFLSSDANTAGPLLDSTSSDFVHLYTDAISSDMKIQFYWNRSTSGGRAHFSVYGL